MSRFSSVFPPTPPPPSPCRSPRSRLRVDVPPTAADREHDAASRTATRAARAAAGRTRSCPASRERSASVPGRRVPNARAPPARTLIARSLAGRCGTRVRSALTATPTAPPARARRRPRGASGARASPRRNTSRAWSPPSDAARWRASPVFRRLAQGSTWCHASTPPTRRRRGTGVRRGHRGTSRTLAPAGVRGGSASELSTRWSLSSKHAALRPLGELTRLGRFLLGGFASRDDGGHDGTGHAPDEGSSACRSSDTLCSSTPTASRPRAWRPRRCRRASARVEKEAIDTYHALDFHVVVRHRLHLVRGRAGTPAAGSRQHGRRRGDARRGRRAGDEDASCWTVELRPSSPCTA